MEFHSSTEDDASSGLDKDCEYRDYQWWLARREDDNWELISWGY